MDTRVAKHCSPEEVQDYRRALLRVFLGEWLGRMVWALRLFSSDTIRAVVITATIEVITVHQMGWDVSLVGVAGWVVTRVNLWACLKASL
jgi:hypothetical protein